MTKKITKEIKIVSQDYSEVYSIEDFKDKYTSGTNIVL